MKRGRIPSVEEMRRTPEPYTRISESIGKSLLWSEIRIEEFDKMPLLKEFADLGYVIYVTNREGNPMEIPAHVLGCGALSEVFSFGDCFRVELPPPKPQKLIHMIPSKSENGVW